jgi:glycosyltransferase involved in cell wall biosynthesis
MTIVHVYAGLVRSGAEGISRNVQGLVDGLARRGEDVRLATAPVELSHLNRLRTHARNVREARTLLRDAAADPRTEFVHLHANIAAMGMAARRLPTRLRRILHVWNAVYRPQDGARTRGARGRWKHRLFNGRRAARWGLASAAEVAVSSRFQAEQLRAIGYGGQIHIVPNGVDIHAFRPATPEERRAARASLQLGEEPVVLYYGHLSAWKGAEHVVEAFARLGAEQPRATLVLAHTDYGRGGPALRALVHEKGLDPRVRFLGLSHVPTLLAAADVVALPPVAAVGTACHPNTLLETLSAGVAVVATHVGSIPEAARPGETALLVPPADPPALAAALSTLIADDALRRRMGRAARQDVLARFDWDLVARRMQSIYHGGARPFGEAGPVAERRANEGRKTWA